MDADTDAGPVKAAPMPGTWSYVYANDIGPGTPGHCGNAGCHATTRDLFMCGSTQDTCYAGLVTAGLVSTTQKQNSLIASKTGPLAWFSPTGEMPQDEDKANAQAASDVLEWLTAGANND